MFHTILISRFRTFRITSLSYRSCGFVRQWNSFPDGISKRLPLFNFFHHLQSPQDFPPIHSPALTYLTPCSRELSTTRAQRSTNSIIKISTIWNLSFECTASRILPPSFVWLLKVFTGEYQSSSCMSRRNTNDDSLSMEGSISPGPAILALKEVYRFCLLIDEAHSFMALGSNGRGSFNHWQDAGYRCPMDEVDVMSCMFSKSVGCTGGFVLANGPFAAELGHQGEVLTSRWIEKLSKIV